MQYVQQKRTHLNFHQSLSLKEFFNKREICLIPSSVNKIFLFQTQTSKLFKLILPQGILTLTCFCHRSKTDSLAHISCLVSTTGSHMRLMICLPNMMSHLAQGLLNCPDSYCQVAAWSLREGKKLLMNFRKSTQLTSVSILMSPKSK